MEIPGKLRKLADKDEDILGIYLFGSHARKDSNKFSDIDICLMLYPDERYSSLFLSEKKLKFLKKFPNLDIQIFQQLPLYIRIRILKEGRRIVCREEDKLYQLVFKTITEYNDYEHILKYYLEEVEKVG